MKRYLRAFAMCQSMFCALPCPWQVWDEEARPLMLAFLPLVGLEIGLLWAGLAWLCGALGMPGTVTSLWYQASTVKPWIRRGARSWQRQGLPVMTVPTPCDSQQPGTRIFHDPPDSLSTNLGVQRKNGHV